MSSLASIVIAAIESCQSLTRHVRGNQEKPDRSAPAGESRPVRFGDRRATTSMGIHLPVLINIPGTDAIMTGFIEEVSNGAASLTVDCLISPETVVRIKHNGSHLVGEVIWCQPHLDSYRMNVLIYERDEIGQRRAARFPVKLQARVYARSMPEPVKGQIIDISSDGLGLELPILLRLDETIVIETESCTAFGAVRYARKTSGNKVRIGVSLHHVMHKEIRSRKSVLGRWMVSKL